MKAIYGVFLTLVSQVAFSLSVTCPKGFPQDVSSESVSTEWHSQGKLESFANVFLLREYEGRELYDVSLLLAEYAFDAKGEEINAPILTASLNVREFKEKPMVQVFVSKETPKATLLIQYGELCGYAMSYELTHNNAKQ